MIDGSLDIGHQQKLDAIKAHHFLVGGRSMWPSTLVPWILDSCGYGASSGAVWPRWLTPLQIILYTWLLDVPYDIDIFWEELASPSLKNLGLFPTPAGYQIGNWITICPEHTYIGSNTPYWELRERRNQGRWREIPVYMILDVPPPCYDWQFLDLPNLMT